MQSIVKGKWIFNEGCHMLQIPGWVQVEYCFCLSHMARLVTRVLQCYSVTFVSLAGWMVHTHWPSAAVSVPSVLENCTHVIDGAWELEYVTQHGDNADAQDTRDAWHSSSCCWCHLPCITFLLQPLVGLHGFWVYKKYNCYSSEDTHIVV